VTVGAESTRGEKKKKKKKKKKNHNQSSTTLGVRSMALRRALVEVNTGADAVTGVRGGV
jgi:hypothetical protein